MSVRLGELLIKRGTLTEDQLQKALRHQREHGGRLGGILVELKLVEEEAIAVALSEQYGVPSVNLPDFEVDEAAIGLIPIQTAIHYQILPLKRVGRTLTVAMADPTNVLALDELKFMTGLRVEPVVAAAGQIRDAIEQHYGTEQTLELQKVYDEITAEAGEYELDVSQTEDELDLAEIQKASSEAPIIKLVNILLADSIRRGASDIHLEPYEKMFRVRDRVDGVLYEVMQPPNQLRDAIVSRLKIMANLDISERRLPQDGRIKIRLNYAGRKREIDFRVSSLPTLFGEKVVLRILDPEKLPEDLALLGFEEDSLKKFKSAIAKPYGMVLVTGPTGSGKTSTLYTCLNQLNTSDVNIMTAEDPVEFNFAGINQVQTSEAIGLTFAKALKAFLRQDPNIIMVGEIRDLETAEIAVKAALTGHLVLSTLHTNDAPSSITRMINMGVEPFLVANSVHLLCAQRLVRRICTECRELIEAPESALVDIGFSKEEARSVKIYEGKGCSKCNETGYKGRAGLFEVMQVNQPLQKLILSGANTAEIRELARSEGMLTLRESGLQKIRSGMTSIEEVLRETAGI